jgi:hypothetical protein
MRKRIEEGEFGPLTEGFSDQLRGIVDATAELTREEAEFRQRLEKLVIELNHYAHRSENLQKKMQVCINQFKEAYE